MPGLMMISLACATVSMTFLCLANISENIRRTRVSGEETGEADLAQILGLLISKSRHFFEFLLECLTASCR